MKLSGFLYNYRTAHEYTKTKMAELIGIEIHNYSRLESGKSTYARQKTLKNISDVLQIDVNILQKINHNPAISNVAEKKFGLLTAKRRLDNSISTWLCVCECGKYAVVTLANLLNGQTSCGCKRHQQRSYAESNMWYLKEGTHLGKIQSFRPYQSNKSGHRGVYCRKNGRWSASIRISNKKIHLGTYANLENAVEARQKAEEQYITPILVKYNLKNMENR